MTFSEDFSKTIVLLKFLETTRREMSEDLTRERVQNLHLLVVRELANTKLAARPSD